MTWLIPLLKSSKTKWRVTRHSCLWQNTYTCRQTVAHATFLPIIIIIYPLTARVVGAPQMISPPVSSIFPCSPLPSANSRPVHSILIQHWVNLRVLAENTSKPTNQLQTFWHTKLWWKSGRRMSLLDNDNNNTTSCISVSFTAHANKHAFYTYIPLLVTLYVASSQPWRPYRSEANFKASLATPDSLFTTHVTFVWRRLEKKWSWMQRKSRNQKGRFFQQDKHAKVYF